MSKRVSHPYVTTHLNAFAFSLTFSFVFTSAAMSSYYHISHRDFFYLKFSVFGCEIFNIFEQACFHNDCLR